MASLHWSVMRHAPRRAGAPHSESARMCLERSHLQSSADSTYFTVGGASAGCQQLLPQFAHVSSSVIACTYNRALGVPHRVQYSVVSRLCSGPTANLLRLIP